MSKKEIHNVRYKLSKLVKDRDESDPRHKAAILALRFLDEKQYSSLIIGMGMLFGDNTTNEEKINTTLRDATVQAKVYEIMPRHAKKLIDAHCGDGSFNYIQTTEAKTAAADTIADDVLDEPDLPLLTLPPALVYTPLKTEIKQKLRQLASVAVVSSPQVDHARMFSHVEELHEKCAVVSLADYMPNSTITIPNDELCKSTVALIESFPGVPIRFLLAMVLDKSTDPTEAMKRQWQSVVREIRIIDTAPNRYGSDRIYFASHGRLLKIGITSYIDVRMEQISASYGIVFTLEASFPVIHSAVEKLIHRFMTWTGTHITRELFNYNTRNVRELYYTITGM